MVTSDGKSQGWICEHQESVGFIFWQGLFLEQLKILRTKFRLKDCLVRRREPLGILTSGDVSFLISRIGIITSDSLSLVGLSECLVKQCSEFLYGKMLQRYKLFR